MDKILKFLFKVSKRYCLISDIVQIICFNLIHVAIDFTEFHINDDDDDGKTTYYKGAFIWLSVVHILELLIPIIVILKIIGYKIPVPVLRAYYGVGAISLFLVSIVVTVINQVERLGVCPKKGFFEFFQTKHCLGKYNENLGCLIFILIMTVTNVQMYWNGLGATFYKQDAKESGDTTNVDQEISATEVIRKITAKADNKISI